MEGVGCISRGDGKGKVMLTASQNLKQKKTFGPTGSAGCEQSGSRGRNYKKAISGVQDIKQGNQALKGGRAGLR